MIFPLSSMEGNDDVYRQFVATGYSLKVMRSA